MKAHSHLLHGAENIVMSIQTYQDQVAKLYIVFFGRAPEAGGFFYWTQTLAKGQPISVIAESFSNSPEFVSQYGSLAP